MAFIWFIILLAILLIVGQYFYKFYTYPHPKFPRGYIGLPIIGFLFHFIFQKNYVKMLLEIPRKYGSICSVQMGSYKVLWLNDYDIVREAWQHPAFAGRPLLEGITDRTFGFRGGLIFNDGEDFVEQQKFAAKTLREFGFGKATLENLILEEALELVESLKKVEGSPVSTKHRFNIASLNTFWTIVAGSRYAHDDPALLELTKILDKNMELNPGAKAAFFMPWLASFFPAWIGWTRYISEAQEIFKFWQGVARERYRMCKDVESPTNFLDAYVIKIASTQDSNSSFGGAHGVQSMAAVLQDLFIAGTETTSVTLSWLFLYLANSPHVQDKLHRCITEVLGSTRPKISDRSRLPYAQAVIMESMRLGTIAPLGMLHRCVQDSLFHGFFIPKDTIVQSNITAIHLNPELWKDPQSFNPERFLSPDQQRIQNFKYFLPFSHGKRKCLGEALAMDELFILLCTIIQEFQVQIPPGHKVSLEPQVGVSAVPQEHLLIFKRRSRN